MDHDHYQWSPLPTRPVLRWPDDARLALCVVIVLEHYEFQTPEGSYTLRRPSGGLFPLPFPDYVRLSHREYGHRVGIFRVLQALDRAGVPPTVAIDALTAEHYPWLIAHLRDRGAELMGHGIAASRLITSRMSEAEERDTIATSLEALRAVTGETPAGWLSPEGAESARTPWLLAEAGVRYVCDWPNDEQPYAMTVPEGELTALPLFLELDDEYALSHRHLTSERWSRMIVEAAERLHADGETTGRLLALSVRPWLTGQPFRVGSLERAIAEITSWPGVWAARGNEIVSWFRSQPEAPAVASA